MSRFSRLSNLDFTDSDDEAESVTPRAIQPGRPAVVGGGTSVASSVSANSVPLFSSPVTQFSASSTGGVKAEVQLFWCEEASLVCRGQIGSDGTRFCCRLVTDCPTRSHSTQKLNVKSGYIYIRAPKANQGANLLPSLPLSRVPEKDRADLKAFLSLKNPRPVWSAFFQACDEPQIPEDDATAKDWEAVVTPQITQYHNAEATLQTPRGLKVGPFFSDAFNDAIPANDPVTGIEDMSTLGESFFVTESASETESVGAAFFDVMAEEWPKIGRNFKALARDVSNLTRSGQLFKEETKDTLLGIQDFVGSFGRKLQIIDSKIGTERIASDYSGLTVWEALGHVSGKADDLAERQTGYKGDLIGLEKMIQAQGRATDAAIEEAADARRSANAFNDEFDEFLAKYRETLRKLKEMVREAKAAHTTSPVKRTKSSRINIGLDDVDEDSPWTEKASAQATHRLLNANLPDRMQSVEDKFKLLDLQTPEYVDASPPVGMEDRLRGIEAKIGSESYSLRNKHFGSHYDLELWVEESKIPSCGHFWDLFSTLVAMNQEKSLTGKTRADSTHSSQRTHSTRSENALIASMDHDWPGCFFHTTDASLATKEDGFTTCRTYDQWIGTGKYRTAYRDFLAKRLETYIIGLKGAVTRVPGDPDWAGHATHLLDKVVTQFGALTTFIESFNQTLTSVSKFSPNRAWGLVGRCVGAIFEFQVTHRAEASNVDECASLRSKAAVIGAVLRCHNLFDGFVKVGFTAHPELVKELTKFMLTERVDTDELRKLELQVSNMKAAVDGVRSENADLRALTTDLKKRIGDLENINKQNKDNKKKIKKGSDGKGDG